MQAGFTLVEVLVAIALFSILMAILIPSITGLLGINRQGERQLSTTTQAQQVIESVKGAWQIIPGMTPAQLAEVQARFDGNCVPGLALSSGITAQSQERTSRAATITSPILPPTAGRTGPKRPAASASSRVNTQILAPKRDRQASTSLCAAPGPAPGSR